MAGLSTCSLIARGTQTRYEQPYSLFSLTPRSARPFDMFIIQNRDRSFGCPCQLLGGTSLGSDLLSAVEPWLVRSPLILMLLVFLWREMVRDTTLRQRQMTELNLGAAHTRKRDQAHAESNDTLPIGLQSLLFVVTSLERPTLPKTSCHSTTPGYFRCSPISRQ